MEVIRGNTLSGYVVTVVDSDKTLTLYDGDATFSDGDGEIIVDSLPDYNLNTISDAEAYHLFYFALSQFENLKAYMNQMDD